MSAAPFGLARASAWAAHAGPAAPTWLTFVALAAAVVVVLFSLGLVLAGNRQPPRRDGDDDGGSGPGGGGPRRPGPDGDDPRGGDPAWWAEFERQFAAYVASQKASVR
jgi:hypothetical protein